jgi:hypothetical protein
LKRPEVSRYLRLTVRRVLLPEVKVVNERGGQLMNENILAAHKLASMDSMRCKNVRLRTRKLGWWSLVPICQWWIATKMECMYNEGCVHRVTRVENLEDRRELEVPDAVRISASVELGMRSESQPTRALVLSVIMQAPNSDRAWHKTSVNLVSFPTL